MLLVLDYHADAAETAAATVVAAPNGRRTRTVCQLVGVGLLALGLYSSIAAPRTFVANVPLYFFGLLLLLVGSKRYTISVVTKRLRAAGHEEQHRYEVDAAGVRLRKLDERVDRGWSVYKSWTPTSAGALVFHRNGVEAEWLPSRGVVPPASAADLAALLDAHLPRTANLRKG